MPNDNFSNDGMRPATSEPATPAEHAQNASDIQDAPSRPLTQERRIRPFQIFERSLQRFSPGEKMVLYVLTAVLAASALTLLIGVNRAVSVTVPARGGSLTEGSIGTPRFINPLLAVSQVDQDMTALVYSGLTRAMPDGTTIADLANSYDVSEDGTTYTFHIRPDATFSNGLRVTAEDVVYTVLLAQSPDIKSPRRSDWEGVTATSTDNRTVVFKLPHAYAPFLENTGLGILPKALWKNVSAEEFPFHTLNTRPVGSGPYQVHSVKTDSTGSPLSYELTPFDHFTLGSPYLKSLTFRFFSNETALLDAFSNGDIDGFAGVSPEHVVLPQNSDAEIKRASSTRIFAIFFNQNHAPVFADSYARAALSAAVDRDKLISLVLSGYGTPVQGPLPPGLLAPKDASSASSTQAIFSALSSSDRVAKAQSLLAKGGWKFVPAATSTAPAGAGLPERSSQSGGQTSNVSGKWMKGKQTLSFALATADTPELLATAHAIIDIWKQVGADVTIQVYPLSELNTTIIRPRAYDAILFGEVVGRTLDLFAFWHSSQRNDPGLNLALYANTKADKLLALARADTDRKDRENLYRQFADIITSDQPAIFLYAPEFIYVVPKQLQGLTLGTLTTPSERFLTINEWYTDTERVWSIFTKNTDQ